LEGKEGRQLAGVALDSGTKGALPSLDGGLDRKEEKSQPPSSSPSMFFLPSLF